MGLVFISIRKFYCNVASNRTVRRSQRQPVRPPPAVPPAPFMNPVPDRMYDIANAHANFMMTDDVPLAEPLNSPAACPPARPPPPVQSLPPLFITEEDCRPQDSPLPVCH